LLSYGLVDYKRAFFDKSVQVLAPTIRVDFSLPMPARDHFHRESEEIVKNFIEDVLNNERFGMSSEEWTVKTLLEDLLGTVVSKVDQKKKYWKGIVKALLCVPQLNLNSNDGVETLENLAKSIMDDTDTTTIRSKPQRYYPKIFIDGKSIPTYPFLSRESFMKVNAYRFDLIVKVSKPVKDLLLEVQWRSLTQIRSVDSQHPNPTPSKRFKYSDVFEDVCSNNNIVCDPPVQKMKEDIGNNP